MFLGSRSIDEVLTFPANTHATTGAATDADSDPSYRVYEAETATPLLTGSMSKLDDANTTGFYTEAITLSAANGFEKGKSYTIYIAATVGGTTGTVSHTFQIAQAATEVLAYLNSDTIAELTTDPGATPTPLKALMLLYMALRNKVDVTATAKEIHNNAGTVVLTKTLSDDGTTYSESKVA